MIAELSWHVGVFAIDSLLLSLSNLPERSMHYTIHYMQQIHGS